MNRGSIGHFEYDAFISYATSPNMEAGDQEDPEEKFVVKLIKDLERGGIKYDSKFKFPAITLITNKL